MYVFMLTQRSTAVRNALACKMALLRSCVDVDSVCQRLATTNRGSYQLLLPLLLWHELENSLLLLCLCLSGACLDLLRGCGFLLARLKSQHQPATASRESRAKQELCVCHGVTHAANIVQRATCHLQLSMRRVFGCSCSCYCCYCSYCVAAGESLASFLGSCLSCLPSLFPLPLSSPLCHTLHTQCAARQCLAAVTNIRLQLFALSQEESGKQGKGAEGRGSLFV